MPPIPFNQIAFVVLDLRRTESWWREGLGFLPAYAHEDQLPALFCLQPDKNSTVSFIPVHQALHITKAP